MSKNQKNQYQAGWLIKEDKSNPSYLFELCDELQNLEINGAAKATITLNGSQDHTFQIQGDCTQARKEYEDLESKRYFSGVLNINWPSEGNLTIKLTINFSYQQLNLVVQRSNDKQVDDIISTVENIFTKLKGLSYEDIEEKYEDLDQIKDKSIEINKLYSESSDKKKELDKLFSEINKSSEKASKQQNQLESLLTESKKAKQELDSLQTEVSKILSEVRNSKTDVNADRENILKKRDEVAGIEEKIKTFFKEIETNQNKIAKIIEDSESAIQNFKERTDDVVDTNEELQEEIKQQLLKATGGRLFGSFEERKSQINTAKWIWAGATCLSLIIQAVAIIWLASEAKDIAPGDGSFYTDPTFLIKASITLPLFILIGFCAKRYSNERDYEEVYAFKSALSFSLSPYLEIIKDTEVKENKDYQEFLLKTITQVFSNPLEKIKEGKSKSSNTDDKNSNLINDLIKLVEKIRP